MTASAADIVGAGTFVSGPSGTSQAVAYPAGWAADDYGLLAVYLDSKSAITTPTGWTALQSVDFGPSTNPRLAVFGRKFAGGDSGTVTVAWASSSSHGCQMLAYRGVDLVNPVDPTAWATGNLPFPGPTQVILPFPTVGDGAVSVLFTAVHDNGGFLVDGSSAPYALGDGPNGRIEQAFNNNLSNLSMAAFYCSQTSVTARSYQLEAGIYWDSAATQDGGYCAVTLKPADGTLQPTAGLQDALSNTYQTGIYRPLLLQPGLRSIGKPITHGQDGDPYLNVQICDTTSSGRKRWLEIGDRYRASDWQRGNEQPADRPRVGTLNIALANNDGLVSPWATSGAYTTSGLSIIRPGTLLRIGVTLSGHSTLDDGWYQWMVGRIEDIQEGTTEDADAWVVLTVTELTAEAAADNREAVAAVDVGGVVQSRALTVLSGEWLYGYDLSRYSDTAVGDLIALQGTTLTGNSLNELYIMGDSTYRRVLGGSDGAIWVTRMFPAAGTAVKYAFSNDPASHAGSHPVAGIVPYATMDRILNKARASNVGGTSVTEGDPVSVRKFGVRAQAYGFPRTDLIQVNHSDLITVVTAWATRHAYDALGIASIDVNADQDPALWGILCDLFSEGLEQHYVIEVFWRHPSGNVMDFVAVLSGFHASLTPVEPGTDGELTATLSLEVFTAPTA